MANINDLPVPAYHLADPGIYAAVSGVRQLAYTSSVGCPYQCNYCTDQVFYKRRFNAYRVERVVDELAELVPRYNIEHVPLFDSNFLVDRKRAVAIAKGIIESGVKFQWDFQTSTDFLALMSEEDVRAARREWRAPHRLWYRVRLAGSSDSDEQALPACGARWWRRLARPISREFTSCSTSFWVIPVKPRLIASKRFAS